MLKESKDWKSIGRAKLGALCGASIFLVAWLAMLGTLGEILLLLPALYVIGMILNYLGLAATQESMLWRGIAAIISAAVFAFIGARWGPSIFSTYENMSWRGRAAAVVLVAIFFSIILFIGRNIRIH